MYRQYSQSDDRIQDSVIDGRTCKRLVVMKGDVAGYAKNTISGIDDLDRLYEGRNSKWNFAVYVPDGLPVTPNSPYKIAGLHADGTKGKPLDFHIYGNELRATVNYNGVDKLESKAYYTRFDYGKWLDIQVSYKMAFDDSGTFIVYLNGDKWFTYRGQTILDGEHTQPGRGTYAQYCAYDNHMPENVERRIVYIQMKPQQIIR